MDVIGYHGTKNRHKDSILENGFNLSADSAWMGSGVYFFESLENVCDGITEAEDWLINVKKITNKNDRLVFEALINTEKTIDLLDNDQKKIYNRIRKALVNKHLKAGLNIEDFNENSIYIKLCKADTDCIRAIVDAKKFLGYHSYTCGRLQLQVCVKDVSVIDTYSILAS